MFDSKGAITAGRTGLNSLKREFAIDGKAISKFLSGIVLLPALLLKNLQKVLPILLISTGSEHLPASKDVVNRRLPVVFTKINAFHCVAPFQMPAVTRISLTNTFAFIELRIMPPTSLEALVSRATCSPSIKTRVVPATRSTSMVKIKLPVLFTL